MAGRHGRAPNRGENEFPFHVASTTTKRCLWDLLGFTTFLDISNQHRDVRSHPFILETISLSFFAAFSSRLFTNLLTILWVITDDHGPPSCHSTP
jgi:hypothetical protein